MSSIFGKNAANQQSGSSLFGGNAATGNTGGGGSLFGNNATTGNTGGGGGLFANNANANNTNNTNNGTTGTGLFGSKPANPMFGASTQAPGAGAGGTGLFGSGSTTQNAPAAGTGLFGSRPTNLAAPTTGTGLFGSQAAPNASTNTNANSGAAGRSIFGSVAPQPQNIQNNNATSILGVPSASLFGSKLQPASSTTFGAGSVNAIQNSSSTSQNLRSSLFQPEMVSVGTAGHTMSHAALQRLQFSNKSTIPNEKSVPEQIETLVKKWSPEPVRGPTSETILRTYFYNAVDKAYAPFFYPQPGESEKSWEEALSKKPEVPKIAGVETSSLAYVPVECVGFQQLGQRLESQGHTVRTMNSRLHEMNSSLSAIMDAHQQRITVKIATAKKQHQLLKQRCLELAVKVQVVRNRGYALDGAEEELRKKLIDLESKVADPGFSGREDDIWARMVTLRERTRWMEEESKRITAQIQAQGGQGDSASGSSGVPENVIVQTRKILRDYDEQLRHLAKELGDVTNEHEEWKKAHK